MEENEETFNSLETGGMVERENKGGICNRRGEIRGRLWDWVGEDLRSNKGFPR